MSMRVLFANFFMPSTMSVKSYFLGSWKHKRWKDLKLYSTLHHSVVSLNVSIAHHAKIGELDMARNLFDEMPTRTVVSWNTMICGYSKWRRYSEALSLVSEMHYSNMKLNETTFSSVLSVCACVGSLCDGKQIHCLVWKSGAESFELVGSALLYFYSSCFKIEEARRVFDVLRGRNELLWSLMLVGYVQCNLMSEAWDVFMRIPTRDVIAWTTLISGYSKREDGCKWALELFGLMRVEGEVTPNEFTLDCVIRACGRLGVLHQGRFVHGLLIKFGFEFDCSIGDALVGFYCHCDAIDDAMKIYCSCTNLCLNASNSLIEGLILMGRIEDAELIFSKLAEANPVSYNLMIKGYAVSGRIEDSKKLFEEMPHRSTTSLNTMISVYSRNGEIDKALELFEETKGQGNPVTWNSMISGYVHNSQHEEALKLYMTMRRLPVDQTRSTFSALFHACSCLGSLKQGQSLHSHLIKTPFESNVYVGTSLIDMYSKCGSIIGAQKSFFSISSPNVAAWTALINGYAHHGLGSEVIILFEQMLEQGVKPNGATFAGLLSACGRAGLVNEGMRLFYAMEKCYGVTPALEHYACMVDLLGRSGHLREAEELIREMPIEADGVVWGALLSSCWFWMDMEVGERVAQKMFKLDPMPICAYVILSNIYASMGKWGEKMDVRKRLRALKVKKDPGCSWLELNNRVHVFSVEGRTNPHCNVIYATLEHLTVNASSIIQFGNVSLPITGDYYFSERHFH
ncbi:putative pentatricopeptide repeat-containing protein At3g25970 isoform X2 [Malania oleifera]|uniref:putative pentatricopeptide repeat-containing protein At3g25970 isoform X2 n=1 Tax=Malania oleifera TaxID=397392 RepID=UPI0025ADDD5D|nr:putative pentatricopeptide repeat-containing protein At3g25970 isoform X2 [Malania oleifera]